MAISRRGFLSQAAMVSMFAGLPAAAQALGANTRRGLRIHNLNTGEDDEILYFNNGYYLRDGLSRLQYVFRDWRENAQRDMDHGLYDIIYGLQEQFGASNMVLISGFRTAKTNAMLRSTSLGVAKNSYHVRGQAGDVRVNGVSTWQLRQAARKMNGGGVGYYPNSNFVHVDTGPIRTW